MTDTMKPKTLCAIALAAAAFVGASSSHAAEWSDTSVGYRYGTKFAEPYNPNDIQKNILNFTHASGYKYGSNFVNVDFLMSDSKETSAHEIYVVYRHTLDLGKVTGKSFAFGPVKGLGLTAGFDVNTKSGDNYESKKRMLVLGPTLFVDVPGFLSVSLLLLEESNKPRTLTTGRYTYDTHPMLNLAWGIPVGKTLFSFEGYMNYIASKGKNEFGGPTSPETNIDATLWYDVGTATGLGQHSVRLGVGYQYWRNKFGNPHNVVGSEAKTPMLRADFHF
jgi:nucleoside-specific outer membrane channel protein Tsx